MIYPVWPFVILFFLFSANFVHFTRTILICKIVIVQCIIFWPPLKCILEFCIRHLHLSFCLSVSFAFIFAMVPCWVQFDGFAHLQPFKISLSAMYLCCAAASPAVNQQWDGLSWKLVFSLGWFLLGLPQFFQIPSTQAGWRIGKEWKQTCSSVKSVLVCSLLPHPPWVWLYRWLCGCGYRGDQAEWRS